MLLHPCILCDKIETYMYIYVIVIEITAILLMSAGRHTRHSYHGFSLTDTPYSSVVNTSKWRVTNHVATLIAAMTDPTNSGLVLSRQQCSAHGKFEHAQFTSNFNRTEFSF